VVGRQFSVVSFCAGDHFTRKRPPDEPAFAFRR
jgi:hypothetical protein